MPLDVARKHLRIILVGAGALILVVFGALLRPADRNAAPQIFTVNPGAGFREIARRLDANGLIRSPFAFEMLGLFFGGWHKIQSGVYELSPASSSGAILADLVVGNHREATVTIPQGASVYEIDALLAAQRVLEKGKLVRLVEEKGSEGRLFPDTYRFHFASTPEEVLKKFLDNFGVQATSLFGEKNSISKTKLILASLLEREVPDPEEQRIVAGILEKRVSSGMPLQVDATICYVKWLQNEGSWGKSCRPLSALDYKRESPYNTYINRGWPPGPIGNPGASALFAALHPISSPYWFYLSDPETGKTVFSKTFAEHQINRDRYLR